MNCRCRYCSAEFEAEIESRVCNNCIKTNQSKFVLVYDPSPADCAYTKGGMFSKSDLHDENMKGCVLKNMRTGELVTV